MTKIDWMGNESLTISDILYAFLGEVTDESLVFNGGLDNNPLAKSLYDICMNDFLSKGATTTDLMKLDQMGIIGDTLVKLWYLCNEDSAYFTIVITYLSGGMFESVFTEEEIKKNLALEHPVPFVPYSDDIIDFKSIRYGEHKEYVEPLKRALRASLIKNYNNELRKENVNNFDESMLLSMQSEETKEVSPAMDEDTLIDISNLYFGETVKDITGGVLGISMNSYSFFERDKNVIKVGERKLFPLKELPSGEYILIDRYGTYALPKELSDEPIMGILPNKMVENANVVNIFNIIGEACDACIDMELIEKYATLINDRKMVPLKEVMSWASDFIKLYSELYGDLGTKKKK